MTEINYTKAQIEEIKANKYVKNVIQRHIVFTKECKIKAIELTNKDIFSKEIFERLWFPKYVINSDIPKNSISRWKRNIKQKWVIEEKKWKTKKEKIDFDNMTLEQENEYLRTKLAYLEELEKMFKNWFP